jgi:NAD+ synthase (glutamine-hydrolysing)
VFDELRYFDPGNSRNYSVVEFAGEMIGISICEDAWNDPDFEHTLVYKDNPIQNLADKGATLLISLTASPYNVRKEVNRFERNGFHAKKHGVPFLSVCQVGANDELIFDGRSNLADTTGQIVELLPSFEESVQVIDTAVADRKPKLCDLPELESMRQALVLGVRDYMRKCGFERAVIGLSGGIDSALTACIAVDALGADKVRGVTMPSHISSAGSVNDSLELAENLGIHCDTVPIADIFNTFDKTLAEPFAGLPRGVTEENLQARIRGTLLMAYSNKTGALLLTTGNKSELAVGYCTLYGDMDGGLAVISDLLKTHVYKLSHWYNRDRDIIPDAILTKAPSAELAPDQKDQDSLPEYDILDGILELYLEQGKSPEQIIDSGYEREIVEWIMRMIEINEYKRWQAAPGLRISQKAFGAGRRMPIAARVDWK